MPRLRNLDLADIMNNDHKIQNTLPRFIFREIVDKCYILIQEHFSAYMGVNGK